VTDICLLHIALKGVSEALSLLWQQEHSQHICLSTPLHYGVAPAGKCLSLESKGQAVELE
jgi:hypothetical protein